MVYKKIINFSIIIEKTSLGSNLDEFKLIRRVFAQNERIWQENVAVCPAKRDINR